MNDQLRRFLLYTPSQFSYDLDGKAKKEIRKALFLSITDQGKFLHWLFPGISEDFVEKEFDWKYPNYLKYLATKRDLGETHSNSAFHSNRPCSRIFRKGEPIYRCLTCGFDETCALCAHCYQPSEHKGHESYVAICRRENGGVCDCGDPEAWNRDFKCPYALTDSNMHDRNLPSDFQDAIVRTTNIILDHIIDVMVRSDCHLDELEEENSKHTVEENTRISALDPHVYGSCPTKFSDMNNGNYCLMLYNDQVHHYRDAVQRVRLASNKFKDFATMVTEKVQNYGRAKVVSSKSIEVLLERQKILNATGLITCIRSERDIFREDVCHELIVWLNDFAESEFFKINTTAKDLFCSAFCEQWRRGVSIEEEKEGEREDSTGSGLKIGRLNRDLTIPQGGRLQHNKAEPPQKQPQTCSKCLSVVQDKHSTQYGSHLQYMIFLDVRFWKAARFLLRDMFSTSLITNLKLKNTLSCQYVDIYTVTAYNFLVMDREPEWNLMSTLSTQLFMSPGNSKFIIQRGDFTSILSSIHTFLTCDKIVSYSPSNEISHEVSIKNLKNRRWGQLFFDISFVISRGKEYRDVLNKESVALICDILELFQGRPVLKREKIAHVEYENPDYSTIFQAVQAIYKFAELSADSINCFENGCIQREERVRSTISYVLKYLIQLELGEMKGVKYENTDINICIPDATSREPITGMAVKVSKVDLDKVSFLHPLHSFLSWLIEYASFPSMNILKEIFDQVQMESLHKKPWSIGSLIFDYPIKTIVLLSQIKAGFWVRNGFSVKSQLQLYRNTGIRDHGYMRDLFLIQVFYNIGHPDFVTYLILDRWCLLENWLQSQDDDDDDDDDDNDALTYDEKILPYMLEECLNFFIHLSTEVVHLKGLSEEELNKIKIKRELMHNLCFEPIGYKKLCSYIPESVVCDKIFDITLNEITIYKQPVGSNDSGVLQLKDEYLDQIDPYYFNYTANRRDDALKFVKNRKCKRWGTCAEDVVVEPMLINDDEDGVLEIYKSTANFSLSHYFNEFIIKILIYIQRNTKEQVEILLDTVLHLIHICCLEQMIDAKSYGSFYSKLVKWSNKYSTSIVDLLYKFLAAGNYESVHSKIRAILIAVNKRHPDLYKVMKEQNESFDPEVMSTEHDKSTQENEAMRRKRIAKTKQQHLLEKFKRQQIEFLKNNLQEDVDASDVKMEDNDEEHGWTFPEEHCILCKNATETAGPFGIIAHIGRSSTFRNVPFDNDYWFLKAFSDSVNLNCCDEKHETTQIKTEKWNAYMDTVKSNNTFGPGFDTVSSVENKVVSSTCGHGMHFLCYLNYVENSRARQFQITRNTPENSNSREILCPLCKSVNNVFIPVFAKRNNRSLSELVSQRKSCFGNLIEKEGLFFNTRFYAECSSLLKGDVEEMLTPETRDSSFWKSWAIQNKSKFEALIKSILDALKSITFPRILEPESSIILSNTIKCAEISLRGVASNEHLVIHQIPNSTMIILRTLCEFRLSVVDMKMEASGNDLHWKGDHPSSRIASNILSLSANQINSTLIEADFFDLLVSIVPIPSLGVCFNTILNTTFVCHVLQCLYIIQKELSAHFFSKTRDYSIEDVPILAGVPIETSNLALACFQILSCSDDNHNYHHRQASEVCISGSVIYSMLMKTVTPFLRRAAIYAFVQSANLDGVDSSFDPETEQEAEKLCSMLNLQTVSEVLLRLSTANTWENAILSGFIDFLRTKPAELFLAKKLEYPGVIKLIDLPERLDFFFSKYYYSDKFDNPHHLIEDPAICLFCAKVVDLQKQAIGCNEGECTTHYLRECSSDVGIFLLPKDRTMLLLHKTGGSFCSAPFLDEQGELPDENKQSKALHLMKPRYNEFTRNVWLQHNVPNYIARSLESVLDPGGWETL
ncbi:hypothetical protein KGF56_004389 [Candida oxycetoniae]|uniref:E3 ubiquitin-protein ligase n=1 Tax=Candida oxycetoniae TaxID=497107 RepID=A0AAI9STR6_9ASCO|nr:uncharacterized protein KGF56_004389 [Candida oxycetoniae]KAI3402715.2 hypothetical protein KGF56_004389 [Candida oxycetoniae]